MKIQNYLLFSCTDSAYNHLIFLKLCRTPYDTAPMKDIHIKRITRPWFDGNKIGLIRKKTFLHTKLHVNYKYFKQQHKIVQREIKQKKANYIKEQIQENNNNPKEL